MSDALARNGLQDSRSSPIRPNLPFSLAAPGCERGLQHQEDRQIPSEAHGRSSREILSDEGAKTSEPIPLIATCHLGGKRHLPTCRDDDARCLDQIACSVPQLAGSGKMCNASLARVAKRECFQAIDAGHAARGVAANHGGAYGRREGQRLLEGKEAEGALAPPPAQAN